MKKLTPLEKFGLIGAIIVSGTYFYMERVYEPKVASLQETVVKLNQIIDQYNAMMEPPAVTPIKRSVERLRAEKEEKDQQLRDAGGRGGEQYEITRILARITSLSEKNRLVVVRMVPAGKKQDAMFNWAVFTTEIRGSYHDFRNFIRELKVMPQPVQLRGVSLERSDVSNLLIIKMTIMI